jgi:nitroreductase
MTMTAEEVEHLKRAHSTKGIIPAILHRWSPRSFSDRPVSPRDLEIVFEAAHWAASSYNEQPWRFLVGTRGSETYEKIFSSLIEINQKWAKSAPVLILDAAKTTFSHNNAPNAVALYDLGAAAATLCYQATAIGLHTHQMGGYDRAVARKAFDIPEDYILGAVMALGYLGEPSALTIPMMLQQETSPRQRKPLSEIVFSAWNHPAHLGS